MQKASCWKFKIFFLLNFENQLVYSKNTQNWNQNKKLTTQKIIEFWRLRGLSVYLELKVFKLFLKDEKKSDLGSENFLTYKFYSFPFNFQNMYMRYEFNLNVPVWVYWCVFKIYWDVRRGYSYNEYSYIQYSETFMCTFLMPGNIISIYILRNRHIRLNLHPGFTNLCICLVINIIFFFSILSIH